MATLGELKVRVRLQTNKDDIAADGEAVQALSDAIASAVEHYAEEPFWFNQDRIAAPPASDGASNIWTTEARELIAARVRMLLYRDLWQDETNMALAASAENEEFRRLMRQSARRAEAPLVTDLPCKSSSFSVTDD